MFAHRGLALEAPENTPLAFLKALAVGAGYIETDVRATLDGIAVISHDGDLLRMTGRVGTVRGSTMSALRELDLGQGQSYCSLAEVLDAFPEARFNLDIKARDAVGPVVGAVLAARAVRRVLVTSFDEKTRAQAVALLPGVATSASSRRLTTAVASGKSGLSALTRSSLRGLDAVQVPPRARGLSLATPKMLRLFRSAGVEVHVWTVNDPDEMRRLVGLGVDGIITDRADLAATALAGFPTMPDDSGVPRPVM